MAKDVVALEAVNIRERTVPPLSKYAFENFCLLGVANYLASEISEMDAHGFVDRLDKCAKSAVNECAEFVAHGEEGQMMVINGCVDLIKACSNKDMVNAYLLSSWCNFPFYEADFGWGFPIWVSCVNFPVPNSVCLIDAREGDGIEAWIHLDEKDMLAFEKNVKLLLAKK